ncbi:MAG TPA: PepSY domain-containing protein [Dongiaceae bacterium]|nr:PepSY domain-containing protein [Dongiaceae bacterium]
MLKNTICLALALALSSGSQIFLAVPSQATATILLADCEAGVKIDGTSLEQTKKRIEAAGYTQVKDLKKGCDNVWHGTAVNKDGVGGNVMVTPQGEVMPEGN